MLMLAELPIITLGTKALKSHFQSRVKLAVEFSRCEGLRVLVDKTIGDVFITKYFAQTDDIRIPRSASFRKLSRT